MSVKQFKFKREKSKLQRQQTRLWQVVDVELPYIGAKLTECKTKEKRSKKKSSQSDQPKEDSEPPQIQLPEIVVNAKFTEVKRRNLPEDKNFVRQLTTLKFPSNRKTEREKRAPLKGWESNFKPDEGIVEWAKIQHQIEAKRGTKKAPAVLAADFYFPIQHKCPNIEDTELFYKNSLHPVHHPKPKKPAEPPDNGVKLQLSNGKYGVLTPLGFLQGPDADDNNTAREIHTYRDAKVAKFNEHLEKRSRSVQDVYAKTQLERNNSQLRIKRLLKFSKDRKAAKPDEEEDEGYSSKTSSAEHKACAESDGEDSGTSGDKLEKHRMYSSMVNLSELPSNTKSDVKGASENKTLNDIIAISKGKFTYTHQPTILQLPNPDIALTHDKLRVEKKIDPDDNYWSYAKLKRCKELSKCYKQEHVQPPEENTVYNISNENVKPVTLVLRKISIQNADQHVPTLCHTGGMVACRTPELTQTKKSCPLLPISRSSSVLSRSGSAVSRSSSAPSRTGSRAGSAMSMRGTPRGNSPQGRQPMQQQPLNVCQSPVDMKLTKSKVRDVRVVDTKPVNTDNKTKEPMWSPHFSFIDRQATNYCIGDLLPAMDKSIYTNHNSTKMKFVAPEEDRRHDVETVANTGLMDYSKDPPADDGYLLLKKGMDLLTGVTEKPTLGPPPFRPNQTRHPLLRNPTVDVNDRRGANAKSSPLPGKSVRQVRVSSEKGPRGNLLDEERETQKKLKEAFVEFYRNRPKEVGKEFRRMQTMWKT